MAHVEDRWYRTVKGPDGRLAKLRTARHGNGLRWRARYLDPDGQDATAASPRRWRPRSS